LLEGEMAKQNLASMSVEALLKLRDDIGAVLGRKADELKQQLSRLGDGGSISSRMTIAGRRTLKGRKVPPKYRDSAGNVWSGRGAQPRWMTAAIKAGAKRDDFLIDKSARKIGKKRRAKK
jgi:DNA-binding protein H-NS